MSATTTEKAETAENRLKATDRCDRCGAQAYVEVLLSNGTLLFCAHHGREHEEALKVDSAVVSINDQRATLEALEQA